MNPHLTLWGVSLFSSLSLSSSFLRAFLHSVLFNKFTIAPFFNGPFFFSFNLLPSFVSSNQSYSILCLLILSPGFGMYGKHHMLPCCQRSFSARNLEINPHGNNCMETSIEKNVHMKYRCRLKQA